MTTTTPTLATVERLSARLGVSLNPGTTDYARAEEALWSASARARSIAERESPDDAWSDVTKVPDAVVDVVLSAALRIYRNPDRYLMNQAGTYQAALSSSDFATGSIFLSGEIVELKKHARLNVAIVNTYRDDDKRNPRFDLNAYVSDGIDHEGGDPFYVGLEFTDPLTYG
ncbi:hypothetical protein RND64_08815 [Gordonia sp. w5E2]|uniref:hypothetical protein n=1 Tax=Gordonia TaxID=2053 RepID=UPI00128FAD05|nr:MULTISPECIES: hypothetical protein [Gordonia]